ncbi:hypothetical protein WH87_04585 [Devosia epidermidihirudinis]|uniref:Putative Flp pilus-assembly TadG-like N-terminal domain-containing protein n=1 Tax=Devosia epidermidihirudinis TaxID=1293439 RepID=A0A0F5QER0_9HYPH|nr:pilus assembly protein TadG-related protein [Devosia epidermidihirudinis]KKC39482.1 hypothetical protein WH87_04585 [Devosia epidermidihirudinis]
MAVLFALLFGLMTVAGAFAVDAGMLYLEKRRVQSAVDMAAIAAARDPSRGFELARQVISDFGLVPGDLKVEELKKPDSPYRLASTAGVYTPNPNVEAEDRFVGGGAAVNAVLVRYSAPGRLFFANAWSPIPEIGAEALAATEARISFSIGSRLAALSGGDVNKLLNSLLGTSVALRLVDYNALANVKLNALEFLDALGIELGLTAGTYESLLSAQATHSQIGRALADTVKLSDRLAVQVVTKVLGNKPVKVGNLISLGGYGERGIGSLGKSIGATVTALDVLRAAAGLANGTKQAQLDLGVQIPGIAALDATLAIGEPMQSSGWIAVGAVGAKLETAQVRLLVRVEIPGVLGILPIRVLLPVYLEVAQSEAVVTSISCPTSSSPQGSAVIRATPGVARLRIGNVNMSSFRDFSRSPISGPAKLLDLLVVRVTASADLQVSQQRPVTLNFSSRDIAQGNIQTASTRTVVGSLTTSLLRQTSLSVDLLTIPLLSIDVVLKVVAGLLTPVAPVVDAVLNQLLDTLGLSVGEMDVKVIGVDCSTPVLVG